MVLERFRSGSVAGEERVAVFVDGPNILRSEFDLDFDVFRGQMEEQGTLAVAKVFLNQYASEKLVEALASQGFEVVVGVGTEEGNEESDVDVYMAVEATEAVFNDTIDTIVLVTRDADFLPLIQKAREHGKRVVLMAVDQGLSTGLRNAADEVVLLD